MRRPARPRPSQSTPTSATTSVTQYALLSNCRHLPPQPLQSQHADANRLMLLQAAGGCAKGITAVIAWYEQLHTLLGTGAAAAAADPVQSFDLIGLSMYPKWSNGEAAKSNRAVALGLRSKSASLKAATAAKGTVFPSIAELPKLAAAFPGKRVYIAETSYPACAGTSWNRLYASLVRPLLSRCFLPQGTPSRGPLVPGYPISEAGQLKYIVDVRAALATALGSQNGGWPRPQPIFE